MTGRSLHAVQLQRNSRGGRIVAAVSYDRHDPEAELSSKELADFVVILDRQGFVGSEVVLAGMDQQASTIRRQGRGPMYRSLAKATP